MQLESVVERGVLYCQIDRFDSISENSDQPCSRLIGVSKEHFNEAALDEGVDAYTIDIAPKLAFFPDAPYDDLLYGTGIFSIWTEVKFQPDHNGQSYVYPTFGADAAKPVRILSVRPIIGISMPSFPSFKIPTVNQSPNWTYSAFEVGQGMASLVYATQSTDAFLFDAGAGTPIKRPAYLANKLTAYDLRLLTLSRDVIFFLSHGDSDHWRMLGWDATLRNRVTSFVVPHGMRRIAFFDKTVRAKVRQRATHIRSWGLGLNSVLDVYRTNPISPTSNNDGLVAVFESAGKRALITGDCVYSELLKDGDKDVRALPNCSYSAIVVPHHGDAASANSIPTPLLAVPAQPVAFFSAGNNAAYGHPTTASLQNHKLAGYNNHVQQLPTGINEVRLF